MSFGGTFLSKPKMFFSVSQDDAKIRRKVKDTGEYQLFDFIEGQLVDVYWKEDSYNGDPANKICFVFENGSERAELQTSESSLFTQDALNGLAAIEGTIGKVRITPYISSYEGKDYVHGAIRHNGEKIRRKYMKDQLPEKRRVQVGAKTMTDDSERVKFFLDVIKDEIKPKLVSPAAAALGVVPQTVVSSAAKVDDDDPDDLPF